MEYERKYLQIRNLISVYIIVGMRLIVDRPTGSTMEFTFSHRCVANDGCNLYEVPSLSKLYFLFVPVSGRVPTKSEQNVFLV